MPYWGKDHELPDRFFLFIHALQWDSLFTWQGAPYIYTNLNSDMKAKTAPKAKKIEKPKVNDAQHLTNCKECYAYQWSH